MTTSTTKTTTTGGAKKFPNVYEAKDGSKRVEMFTPISRLSFGKLDKPDALEGQKPKYKGDLLMPGTTDTTELEKMIDLVGSSKFGKSWEKIKAKQHPIKDGNDKDLEKNPQYEGMRYITPKSEYKPKLYDQFKKEIEQIPSGYWVRAQITIYPYEMPTSKGVALALTAVKIVREDDTFGGGGNHVDPDAFPDDGDMDYSQGSGDSDPIPF